MTIEPAPHPPLIATIGAGVPWVPGEQALADLTPEQANAPLNLNEARQALADNGIDGPDQPYNPRALRAMRIADALLARVVELTSELTETRGGVLVVATALDRLGARIHRDLHVDSSYLDVSDTDPQLARVLRDFSDLADECLEALDHPVVLASSTSTREVGDSDERD